MYKTIYTVELQNFDTEEVLMRLTTTNKDKAFKAYDQFKEEMMSKGLEPYANTHHVYADGHFSNWCMFDDDLLDKTYFVEIHDLEFISRDYPQGTTEVTENIVRYFE